MRSRLARTIIGLGLLSLLGAFLLTSCGGKGSSGKSTAEPITSYFPSYQGTSGSTESSYLPGRVQLVSVLTLDELRAQIEPMGYQVVRQVAPGIAEVQYGGRGLEQAMRELSRVQGVFEVTPVMRFNAPTLNDFAVQLEVEVPEPLPPVGSGEPLRELAFQPNDHSALNQQRLPGADPNDPTQDGFAPGQNFYLEPIGWQAALDYLLIGDVVQNEVVLAIIDAGIFMNPPDDPDNPLAPNFEIPQAADGSPFNVLPQSAFVDAANPNGIVGLENVRVEFWDHDGDPGTPPIPVRATGNRIFGMLDALVEGPRAIFSDRGTPGDPTDDAVWGMAGLMGDIVVGAGVSDANQAKYLIIKTGQHDGSGNWQVTEQDIAAAINYAVSNGADIIVTGYALELPSDATPVSAELQNAIDNARNNGVLVIAPVGGNPQIGPSNPFFQDPDGSTSQTPPSLTGDESFTYSQNRDNDGWFTPAKANGVISVGAIGCKPTLDGSRYSPRQDIFNDTFFGGNIACFHQPFDSLNREVASWSGAGADLYGPGFNLNTGEGLGTVVVRDIGTHIAAASVAAAAAYAYQAVINRNGGSKPNDIDDQVESSLINTALQVGGIRILSMPTAIASAASGEFAAGGGASGLRIVNIEFSNQPGTPGTFNTENRTRADVLEPFGVKFDIVGGTGPYEAKVEWYNTSNLTITSGDFSSTDSTGSPIGETGNIFALTAAATNADFDGYPAPGTYEGTILVRDTSDGSVVSQPFTVFASQRLAVNILIIDSQGNTVPAGQPLSVGQPYTFYAQVDNVMGLAGTQVEINWDINGQPFSGQIVEMTFNNPGTNIRALVTVTEGNRTPALDQVIFNVQ